LASGLIEAVECLPTQIEDQVIELAYGQKMIRDEPNPNFPSTREGRKAPESGLQRIRQQVVRAAAPKGKERVRAMVRAGAWWKCWREGDSTRDTVRGDTNTDRIKTGGVSVSVTA
jgi:hypothetical protein